MCVNGLSLSGQKGCHGDLRASKDHIISCSFSSYINETHYQQSGSFFFFFFPRLLSHRREWALRTGWAFIKMTVCILYRVNYSAPKPAGVVY